MNDRERAVIMAYTGYAMLCGDKLNLFYEYVSEKIGHPVYTHELADPLIIKELHKAAKEDFIELCREQQDNDRR